MSNVLDASTVLLLREAPSGPEVFMLRRHGKSSFMANAWVYPGGRVDEADGSPAAVESLTGFTPAQAAGRLGLEDPARAAALYLAAIRETFEESGVLLAHRNGSADWLSFDDPELAARFEGHREKLQKYEIALSALAEDEELVFPLDQLGFFAHWITPTFEPKRFDTYFFLCRMPPGQEPLHDDLETTDSFWTTAPAALDLYASGELFLAPPTFRTLERLAAFETIDAAFASCEGRQPSTILPHLVNADEGPLLLFPGDRDYPDLPEYSLATPVSDGPTRIALIDGLWRHA